ncbi:TetR/AcrR family transcriptional regulator [Rhodococcus tukisamuensis]|uniref:Regulatory protein, tetR family n=1 Tax=Rhodococcus tukisamuensis TaxID=168276 RepID=A0A1G6X5P5_9NOCA|nr:TetR/AcrR family transcriptional regulator [Rhodococcus tukisamuensis]SDD73419.1 regulatory protein, tetR family [Rhodococcus tukisamuensis]
MSERTPARERILAAVLHVIGTDGIAAVTNRRIAAQAQVSLGSITYHFPSQTDMLRDALLGFVTEETARLTELAEQYRDHGLSVQDAASLTEQVVRDLGWAAERVAPFELYIQAGRDPALQEAASECFAAYDTLTVTILEALGVPNAAMLAPTLVATIAGLQLRRLATGGAGTDVSTAILLLVGGAQA